MQNISVIGSTGSVGTQALNIIRHNRDKFKLVSLSAHSNITLLKQQLTEFKPLLCVITDKTQSANITAGDFPGTEILFGEENLPAAVTLKQVDTVLISVVGLAALMPAIAAIQAKKRIALANKEIMVAAGELVTNLAIECRAEIIPVDSEHSAIFQCLHGKACGFTRLILTASGGPFRTLPKSEFKNITLERALRHPNWSMGKKITIDSATLMNKGLEVIEAKWLFNTSVDKIECVVHPQSIIHSMAEFEDSSVLAQMSYPSMEIPISLAFTYPDRIKGQVKPLNFTDLRSLEFYEVDHGKFPCLNMAYEAVQAGGLIPAVLNSANEAAVELFLGGRIGFTDIPKIIEKSVNKFSDSINLSLESVYYIDGEVKKYVRSNY